MNDTHLAYIASMTWPALRTLADKICLLADNDDNCAELHGIAYLMECMSDNMKNAIENPGEVSA